MADQTEIIVALLKNLIDKNGPDYLSDKPYNAYKELREHEGVESAIAAAI